MINRKVRPEFVAAYARLWNTAIRRKAASGDRSRAWLEERNVLIVRHRTGFIFVRDPGATWWRRWLLWLATR